MLSVLTVLQQIRIDPGTMTIAAHQDVGSVTRDITPRFSILCNLCLTFSRKGIGVVEGLGNN